MGLWDGLARGARAMFGPGGSQSYRAGGLKVACPHCRTDRFKEGRALLNTAGMTMMNLDWANKQATTLMCERCGLVQWFGIPPIPEYEEGQGQGQGQDREPSKPYDPDAWSDR